MDSADSAVFVGAHQTDPLMMYQLGEFYYQQGNLVEAEKAYLASGIPAAYNNLGVILHQRRDYVGCIRCWVLSGNVDAVNNLERLLEEQGRSQEFAPMLLKINSPASYHRLALMHLEKGDLAAAEELLRLSPTKEAWTDLGVLLARRGKLEEAEQLLRKGRDPFYNLGLFYWKEFQPPRLADAELCLLKCGTPTALFHLGRMYELHGEPSRAAFKYWKSGTERALVQLGCLYLRHGLVREAERVFKPLFVEANSLAAGYYLLNLYQCRNDLKKDPAVMNLPRISPQEQKQLYGVHASLPLEHRQVKPHRGSPPKLEVIRRVVEQESSRKRMIRVCFYDERKQGKFVAMLPEEKLLAEDVHAASFRIRLECRPELEDVEIIEYEPGKELEALARPSSLRGDVQRMRQVQVRDWLIYVCASIPAHTLFKSPDRLPLDSDAVTWSLKQVILHPAYQMQSLSLVCSDGVVKQVEGGVIRPLSNSSSFFEEDSPSKPFVSSGGGGGGIGAASDKHNVHEGKNHRTPNAPAHRHRNHDTSTDKPREASAAPSQGGGSGGVGGGGGGGGGVGRGARPPHPNGRSRDNNGGNPKGPKKTGGAGSAPTSSGGGSGGSGGGGGGGRGNRGRGGGGGGSGPTKKAGDDDHHQHQHEEGGPSHPKNGNGGYRSSRSRHEPPAKQ